MTHANLVSFEDLENEESERVQWVLKRVQGGGGAKQMEDQSCTQDMATTYGAQQTEGRLGDVVTGRSKGETRETAQEVIRTGDHGWIGRFEVLCESRVIATNRVARGTYHE